MINEDKKSEGPLLSHKAEEANISEEDMFDPASTPPSTWKIFRTFLRLTIPAILTNVLFTMCNVILLIYAGLIDDPIYVAVVGITGTLANFMILSILIGLNGAQETLTS